MPLCPVAKDPKLMPPRIKRIARIAVESTERRGSAPHREPTGGIVPHVGRELSRHRLPRSVATDSPDASGQAVAGGLLQIDARVFVDRAPRSARRARQSAAALAAIVDLGRVGHPGKP